MDQSKSLGRMETPKETLTALLSAIIPVYCGEEMAVTTKDHEP